MKPARGHRTGPADPARRWLITGVGAAIGIAALLYWLGLSARHSVLLGVCLLLAATTIPIIGMPTSVQFRRLPYQRRDGARREVSTLSWSLYGDKATLREPALRRLHSAGLRACGHAGIDLDSPDGRRHATAVLGPQTVAFLEDPRAVPVDSQRMRHYLTAFERLDLRKGLV